MKPQLTNKNLAVGQLQEMKGTSRKYKLSDKYSASNVAQAKVIRISNENSAKQAFAGFTSQDKKNMWYSVGVSIIVFVLFVVAIKYKWIKL